MRANWNETTLEDICIRITDGSHSSPVSVENGLPMASVKDLTSYGVNLSTCRHISEDDFASLVRQGCQPKKGDVLVAKDGATALDTVCEIRQTQEVVLLSSVAILRPNIHKITSSYLHYFMDCETTRQYLKGGFVTGAAIPRVVLKDFKRCKVSLPPLPTQRKIAAILSAYDDLIENNTRRVAILEEMAQSLYREWFVHFHFPGHEKNTRVESPLGMIPQGWEVVKLEDVASINRSTIKKGHEPFEISYVDIDSVSTGKIDAIKIMPFVTAPSRARRIAKHGDIIWSTVRPNRKSYSLILNPVSNLVVSTGFAVISASKLPYTYLYEALTTNDFVNYLTNSATGSAYPAVNSSDFQKAVILQPSKVVLDVFHDIVTNLFEEKQNLQQKNAILRRTCDLLLPKLISGELDVEGLDIEVGGDAEDASVQQEAVVKQDRFSWGPRDIVFLS